MHGLPEKPEKASRKEAFFVSAVFLSLRPFGFGFTEEPVIMQEQKGHVGLMINKAITYFLLAFAAGCGLVAIYYFIIAAME